MDIFYKIEDWSYKLANYTVQKNKKILDEEKEEEIEILNYFFFFNFEPTLYFFFCFIFWICF